MNNFYENQKELMELVHSVFEEKKDLCEKNNRASSFIDPDFFDHKDEEENIICEQIQKRLHVLCENLKNKITQNFEDEETSISFQTLKDEEAPYESICFLHGYVQDDEDKKPMLLKKLPKYVEDFSAFVLIVDTLGGPKLIPWQK